MLNLTEILYDAVWLATSVQSWTDYAKFLLGLGVGLLVVSGGLFVLAWTVAQKARGQWFGLAKEWAKSSDFRDAVNEARRELTERLILEMHNEIDKRIEAHDGRENIDAHRAAITHVVRNFLPEVTRDMTRQLDALDERLKRLEGRRHG